MKYMILVNIINNHIPEDELVEMFRLAKKYTDAPYREDYEESDGGGYMEIVTEINRTDRNIRLELVYSGEGPTFEEKSMRMKNKVESGQLQRSLLYKCESDVHRSGATRVADKVTATIMWI